MDDSSAYTQQKLTAKAKDIRQMKALYKALAVAPRTIIDHFKSPKAIIVCGNTDIRIAQAAALEAFIYPEAYVMPCGKYNIFTEVMYGGNTEADVFAKVLEHEGVKPERMLKDDLSFSVNGNLKNAKGILKKVKPRKRTAKDITIVCDAPAHRRMIAKARKFFPQNGISIVSPEVAFDEYQTAQMMLGRKGDKTYIGCWLTQLYEQTVSEEGQNLLESGTLRKFSSGKKEDHAYKALAYKGYASIAWLTQKLLRAEKSLKSVEIAQRRLSTFLIWLRRNKGKGYTLAIQPYMDRRENR